MSSPVLKLVIDFAMLMVLVLLAIEVHGWITGTRVINRKQKGLRIASAGLILVILAMVLIGDGPARAYHPLMAIGYWALCFSFACMVVVLALADMKQVTLRFEEERKHNFEEMARGDDSETR